jgi:hypothetical protein
MNNQALDLEKEDQYMARYGKKAQGTVKETMEKFKKGKIEEKGTADIAGTAALIQKGE